MQEESRVVFIKDRKLGFGLKAVDREDGGCFAYLPSGAIAMCKDYEPVQHDEVPGDILPTLLSLHAEKRAES